MVIRALLWLFIIRIFQFINDSDDSLLIPSEPAMNSKQWERIVNANLRRCISRFNLLNFKNQLSRNMSGFQQLMRFRRFR